MLGLPCWVIIYPQLGVAGSTPVSYTHLGVLGLVGKGVGTKGSLAGMLKQVGDDIHPDPRLPIYYGYSGDDTLCRQFVPLMEEKFGPHGQEIRSIGCVIGTHLGPNAAVVAYLEQDK